ncbi:hypothetical protein [Xanthobacter autotrophicus]|uniref:hypothetical protein n=1 Tax=Xanthobacter autotrophicus TaxID=280 RepID=UPI00372708B9
MLEGHVEITIGGQPATLVPSLGAAMALCQRHESFGTLLAKIESLDLIAAVDVVRFGLGRRESEQEATAQQVFEAGVLDLMPRLARFVFILANGGRPPKDEGEVEKPGTPFAG